MVFQHFGLFEHRSVAFNVGYGLRLQGKSRTSIESEVQGVLRQLGLVDWADALPSALSGGMRQRVGLARALVTNAKLLLMDEPFSAVDPETRYQLQELVVEIHKATRPTIVFVTHDPAEAMRLGERLVVLEDGHVRADLRPAEQAAALSRLGYLHPDTGSVSAATYPRDTNSS